MTQTTHPTWRSPARRSAAVIVLFGLLCGGGHALAEDEAEQVESAAPGAIKEAPIGEYDRDHWSFRPLSKPAIPSAASGGASHPVDAFIDARLADRQLRPLPPAARRTIMRRVTFDLTGLPPTAPELEAFVADDRPDAYDRVVDRLLASSSYGEHWAQFWLDLSRFAETDGFEFDAVRPEAWRYRDWVIAAFNDDLPYDRFLTWQVAGDEVAPDKREARIATMFCLNGPDMPDVNSQEERRSNVLNELTGTVGAALLGLQVGCAQCHDHKYDPISQADFYRLRATFAAAVKVKARQSLTTLAETSARAEPSHLLLRGDWRHPGPQVEPAVPRIANLQGFTIDPPAAGAKTTGRRTAFARWLTDPANPLTARVIVNRVWQQHFGRGLSTTPSDFGLLSDEPSHPELLDWLAVDLIEHGWSLKHLQRRIVTSAAYRRASRPEDVEQPAGETLAADWEQIRKYDSTGRLLAAGPRKRLTGEAIRDAMLAAAGSLSDRRGGPGIMGPLPKELLASLSGSQWKVAADREDHHRRSVYLFARRNLRYPLFEAFDRPDGNASCPRRERSTTAPQSLLLLNSEFSLTTAQHLAGHLLAHAETESAQIELAFARALARPPTPEELQTAQAFLAEQAAAVEREGRKPSQLALPLPTPQQLDLARGAALTDFCLALFNLNEFLYID